MAQNDSARDVACTLTEEQERARSDQVQRILRARYAGFEENEDDLEIQFDGTDESLRAVAEFASNELQCCSFAEYSITVSPPYEQTVLTLSGPDGTVRHFRDGLVEQLQAD